MLVGEEHRNDDWLLSLLMSLVEVDAIHLGAEKLDSRFIGASGGFGGVDKASPTRPIAVRPPFVFSTVRWSLYLEEELVSEAFGPPFIKGGSGGGLMVLFFVFVSYF